MSKFAAIIVSYNPDVELLKRNIEAISDQVEKVIIYDNSSNNITEISNLIVNYNNVFILKSKTNDGISKAINNSVKTLDKSFEWFLTLDQDSISPPNLIAEYSKYINLVGVKMISPRVLLEIGKEIQKQQTTNSFEYINRCITSACLINTRAFYEVGGMDEQMFIDWVDHDICKHFEILNFKMLQCNNVLLYHNLGSSTPIALTSILNKYIGTKILYEPYSAFRIYYMIRNTIYYMRKYDKYIDTKDKKKGWKLIIQHVSLKSVVLGKSKIKILKAIFKGLKDGYNLSVNLNKKYI